MKIAQPGYESSDKFQVEGIKKPGMSNAQQNVLDVSIRDQISSTDIFNASILIVDDQKLNTDLLEDFLEDEGYRRVSSVNDPNEVCALHREHDYDLILLDLEMPGMDGFEVIEAMRQSQSGRQVPILVITAYPDQKIRSLALGAKDFITKPYNLNELTLRIRNLLEVRLLYKKLDQQNRVLKSMALHDELTSLPNRRLLMDRLSSALAHARRARTNLAVIYLDLDGFKQINDTLGHDVGDSLLCLVSNCLISTVRQEDTVARIGGDEFVIVLPEISHASDAAEFGKILIQAVSRPYRIKGRDVQVTASIGVSIYPFHGEDVGALMKSADLALYEAKHSGKNDFRISAYVGL